MPKQLILLPVPEYLNQTHDKKRAIEIVRMLSRTIRTMKDSNQWEGNCTVIKSPRAKKKEFS